MSRKYRILFLSIFSIFFIVTTPFLILYSLGYDLSLEDRELRNSLSISIDTRPRLADVYSNDKLLLRSSGELRANENQLIPLSVREEGYLEENFLVWSGENENTTARITNLWLLPDSSQIVENDETIEFINILSRDQAVIRQNQDYFVQLYSFGGLQGNAEEIISGDSNTIINFDQTTRWYPVNETTFWNKKSEQILLQDSNRWKLFDTRFFSLQIESIAYISNNELLILDTSGNIWIWNHNELTFRFVDSGFEGMSYTDIPNYIWLWNYDTIFRISPNQFTENTLIDQFEFTNNQLLADFDRKSEFVIKNVYQGIFVHVDSYLVYIPDYNKSEWVILSNDVLKANSANESIIWIDSNDQIWVINLELNKTENVTAIEGISSNSPDDIDLFYYFLWKRIMVYTPSNVQAIWYDKDILNSSVVGYNHKNWVENTLCYTELIDRYQFCIENNRLTAYRNTSIW